METITYKHKDASIHHSDEHLARLEFGAQLLKFYLSAGHAKNVSLFHAADKAKVCMATLNSYYPKFERRQKLLRDIEIWFYMAENPKSTIERIAKRFNLNRTSIERVLGKFHNVALLFYQNNAKWRERPFDCKRVKKYSMQMHNQIPVLSDTDHRPLIRDVFNATNAEKIKIKNAPFLTHSITEEKSNDYFLSDLKTETRPNTTPSTKESQLASA